MLPLTNKTYSTVLYICRDKSHKPANDQCPGLPEAGAFVSRESGRDCGLGPR
jgi:hypothetical protein